MATKKKNTLKKFAGKSQKSAQIINKIEKMKKKFDVVQGTLKLTPVEFF